MSFELAKDLLGDDGNVLVKAGEILIKYDFSDELYHPGSNEFYYIAPADIDDYLV